MNYTIYATLFFSNKKQKYYLVLKAHKDNLKFDYIITYDSLTICRLFKKKKTELVEILQKQEKMYL